MFGAWSFGLPPEDLTERQRPPPPAPTELRFPCYTLPAAPYGRTASSSSQRLYDLFASIRNPRDITPQHISSLNLQLTRDVPLQELTRPQPASEPSLPLKSPVTTPSDRLALILTELSYQNHPAYREITRLPPLPGQSKPRLAHVRKFWIALERMSLHWDTGRDTLLTVPEIETKPSSETIPGTDVRAPLSERSNSDTPMPDAPTTQSAATDPSSQKLKQVYTGHRTSTGSACPAQFLDDTVRSFLEPLAWSFNSQITSSSLQARLAIRTLLLSVRPTLVVGRTPKERESAKKGILEGPILGCWCREWDYEAEAKGEKELRELEDLLREVGAIVELAQERAREGKQEEKPGEGMWWSSKPRWGGGDGGPMGWEEALEIQSGGPSASGQVRTEEPAGGGDRLRKRPLSKWLEDATRESKPKQEETTKDSNKKDKAKLPKRNPMAEKWKTVRPGTSLWDKKWRYMKIGRNGRSGDEDGDGDEIYLISSVNHHIRVMRAVVGEKYLRWLAGDADGDGGVLRVESTRWFDLLDPEDRVELMQGLWELMERLMGTR